LAYTVYILCRYITLLIPLLCTGKLKKPDVCLTVLRRIPVFIFPGVSRFKYWTSSFKLPVTSRSCQFESYRIIPVISGSCWLYPNNTGYIWIINIYSVSLTLKVSDILCNNHIFQWLPSFLIFCSDWILTRPQCIVQV